MTSTEILKTVVKALDSKKAEGIKVLHIQKLTQITDYFVLASGTNVTQVKSLADEVEYKLGQQGLKPQRTEGYQSASWIVLDYSSVIVHVFYPEARKFYDLERLWQDGEEVDISEWLNEGEAK